MMLRGLFRLFGHSQSPCIFQQQHYQQLRFLRSIPKGVASSQTTGTSTEGSSTGKDDQDQVVLTDDGRVLVCWHPEPEFEYSLSKPIPLQSAYPPVDINLKVQSLYPVKELFRPKHERMMIRELMHLTHTAKYRWYPKARRVRYREMNPNHTKRDREYL